MRVKVTEEVKLGMDVLVSQLNERNVQADPDSVKLYAELLDEYWEELKAGRGLIATIEEV